MRKDEQMADTNITLPIKSTKLTLQDISSEKLFEFINKFSFLSIAIPMDWNNKKENSEHHVEMGTPFDENTVVEENGDEETAEDKEEEKKSEAYQNKQAVLTKILIRVQEKTKAHICRIHQAKGISVIMIRKDLVSVLQDEIKGTQKDFVNIIYEIREIDCDSMYRNKDDLANLLTQYMEYCNAERLGYPIPYDSLLTGYHVYLSGEICSRINGDRQTSPDSWQNVFLSLYIKDQILQIKVDTYWETGPWIDRVLNDHRREKIRRDISYTITQIGKENWILVKNYTKPILTKPHQFKPSTKNVVTARVKGTAEKFRHQILTSRTAVMQKFITDFNRFYDGIIEIICNEKNFIVCPDEVYKRPQPSMNEINEIRRFLYQEFGGTIHITHGINIGNAQEKQTQEETGINKAREKSFCDEMLNLLEYAKYVYTFSCKNGGRITISQPKEYECLLYADMTVTLPNAEENETKKKKTHTPLPIEYIEESKMWVFDVPPTANGKITVTLMCRGIPDQDIGDPDLPVEIVLSKTLIADNKKAKATKVRFKYKEGFGIYDATIDKSEIIQTSDLCLCFINSHESHDYTHYLNVQHVAMDTISDKIEKNKNICLQCINELYIKGQLTRNTNPDDGEVISALFIGHVPRTRRREGYNRYFLYCSPLHNQGAVYREIDENEASQLFPEIIQDSKCHYIKTANGIFRIKQTDIRPITGWMYDKNGNLKDLQEIGSVSQQYGAAYAGMVGVAMHENTKEKCIAYFVGDYPSLQDVNGGFPNFPHMYIVTQTDSRKEMPSTNTLRSMLTVKYIRPKRYTALPYIFKYLREWAKTAGVRYEQID